MIAGPDFHSPEIHHLLFGFYLECASIWVVKLKNKRNKYFLSSFGTSLGSFRAVESTLIYIFCANLHHVLYEVAFLVSYLSCLSFPHLLAFMTGLGNQVGSTTDHP